MIINWYSVTQNYQLHVLKKQYTLVFYTGFDSLSSLRSRLFFRLAMARARTFKIQNYKIQYYPSGPVNID